MESRKSSVLLCALCISVFKKGKKCMTGSSRSSIEARPTPALSFHTKASIFTRMKDHRLIDERSLAFDRRIAAKLREDATLVDKARANLNRWLVTCAPGVRPDLLEWRRLLDGPFPVLLALLEGTSENATRLRQSSPFCGILTPGERTGILREFQARESAAA